MENPEDSFNLSNQILNRERTVEEVADRAMYEDTDAKDAILAYEKKMEPRSMSQFFHSARKNTSLRRHKNCTKELFKKPI
jgi:hypothetical protein